MALSGNTLAVGAYGDDHSSCRYNQANQRVGKCETGAIYIFTRSGSTWSLQKEISSNSPVTGITTATLSSLGYFSRVVALDGDTLVVGVYGANADNCTYRYSSGSWGWYGLCQTGAVYIFTRSGSTWSLQKEISPDSTVSGFSSTTLKAY